MIACCAALAGEELSQLSISFESRSAASSLKYESAHNPLMISCSQSRVDMLGSAEVHVVGILLINTHTHETSQTQMVGNGLKANFETRRPSCS